MTPRHNSQQILTKAIKKAIAGGWHNGEQLLPFELLDSMLPEGAETDIDPSVFEIKHKMLELDGGDYVNVEAVIFDHDFARALWGKGKTFKHKDGTLITIENPNYWKVKLRSMVVAKDPIKYLGEHI